MRQRRITTLIIFLIATSLIALGLTLNELVNISTFYSQMIAGA